MNEETQKKLDENNEMRYLIVGYREKILKLENKIKTNEKYIFKHCNHDWQFEYGTCMNDRNYYFCKHCKLYRNSYMYIN